MSSRVVWRLKKGADRRFKSGHPWVYSNELQESPKGIEPGAPVELQDAGGKFLARGYGNAQSLIAFRVLTRDPAIQDPSSKEAILTTLKKAYQLRRKAGLGQGSFRLCFGEVDHLPGLIIDCYRLEGQSQNSGKGQVFVLQAHSAGANQMLPQVIQALEAGSKDLKTGSKDLETGSKDPGTWGSTFVGGWEQTSVVIRNDLGVRKLEGLQEEEVQIWKHAEGHVLESADIRIQTVLSFGQKSDFRIFNVDLVYGQKTGFFLDQFANIELTAMRLRTLPKDPKRPLRILDLCCYVGQWGVQLAKVFQDQGSQVEVVAVDASAKSLERATRNLERQGASCKVRKADVIKDLANWDPGSFDLVIVDPPALIKSRKDIAMGIRGYTQLFQHALKQVRPGGGIVCCSCSGLLDEETFASILAQSERKSGVSIQWVGRGTHSPDHPMLPEFPEGRYLKCWIGVVEE